MLNPIKIDKAHFDILALLSKGDKHLYIPLIEFSIPNKNFINNYTFKIISTALYNVGLLYKIFI